MTVAPDRHPQILFDVVDSIQRIQELEPTIVIDQQSISQLLQTSHFDTIYFSLQSLSQTRPTDPHYKNDRFLIQGHHNYLIKVRHLYPTHTSYIDA